MLQLRGLLYMGISYVIHTMAIWLTRPHDKRPHLIKVCITKKITTKRSLQRLGNQLSKICSIRSV
jgi:hypothetical protein